LSNVVDLTIKNGQAATLSSVIPWSWLSSKGGGVTMSLLTGVERELLRVARGPHAVMPASTGAEPTDAAAAV
jgi:hypothetical protein